MLHPYVDINESKINIFKETVQDATFLDVQWLSNKINVRKVLIEEQIPRKIERIFQFSEFKKLVKLLVTNKKNNLKVTAPF